MITLPGLSFGPRIRGDGDRLVLKRLSLTATIDPSARTIVIDRRSLLVFPSRRTIRFAEVEGILYGCRRMPLQLSFAHDTLESYDVGLRLVDGFEEIVLVTFRGPGSFRNETSFPDWLMHPLLDFAGSHDRSSRTMAEALAKLIGVPVRPPAY